MHRFQTFAVFALLFARLAWADHPYRGGAVAAAYGPASLAAKEMLDRGGNAVDAAVAAALTAGVVGPYHSGLGGGGFALWWDAKTGKARLLDFRETAPGKATPDMYLRDGKPVPQLSIDGALAVATPGAVAGYCALHEAGGKLPRAVVFEPAIRAAKEGFWVTPKYQQMAKVKLAQLQKDAESQRLFLRPGNGRGPEVPKLGTLIRQPELSRTLAAIAKKGPEAFYRGDIARRIVETVQSEGGILSADDLAHFQVRWRDPVEGDYEGYRVVSAPPPSAGGLAVLQALKLLELEGAPALPFRSAAATHALIEALRRVYLDRARYLGDPAFVEIPVQRLLSEPYLKSVAAEIDPKHAARSAELLPKAVDSNAPPEGEHTTHLSVVDRDGNAVAMTTTVNGPFGAGVLAPGTGVVLNNEMDDFAAKAFAPNLYGVVTGEANRVAPGKIPLSSMSPTLVFQKGDRRKVMLVVGSPGGSTIPTTVIQVIRNVIDGRMDVERAVNAPRIHHQLFPDIVLVEPTSLDAETRQALEAMGQHFQPLDGWGDAEAAYVDPETGLRYSASDPRNEGLALGQD